ncbi:MAG TPA: 16S rRNA (cytidine(1402)-2'-O)-methyltransferase [Candidatus Gallacutalibacter pullistercoris]|nr:16S rRNA (cytidine(1402)-2'-O)-methyltransferase [Candidatus Gallacutalibacter pullistercoris]
MSGMLYVVGTPIGNLSDFSPRAQEILSQVDFIAAEDTRVTLKLLNHFGIKKPMVSYFEHNKYQRGEMICDRIQNGETCALVSDAGMPAISDPGEMLVAQCAEREIPVQVVPGPSAVVSALAISGLPTGRFTFEGFLSTAKKSRREHLAEVKTERRTMVFYEAPHKLLTTLEDMLAAWGDRRISIVRELTKIHEEVRRTTLSQAVAYYRENTPKGEFVLVIEGAAEEIPESMTLGQAVQFARELMEQGCSASEAAKQAAQASDFKKGELYRLLMEEKA